MHPLAIVFILIGFSCGAAALIKSLRSKNLPSGHTKVSPLLGNIGGLFIIAGGIVFILNT